MDPGATIRNARRRARLTQAELAARLGTTQSAVSRWERGGVTPSARRLAEIVTACDAQLEWRLAEPSVEYRADEASLEARLRLTPEQRLRDLVHAVRFIQAGRMARARAATPGSGDRP